MADKLIKNELPTVEEIQLLYKNYGGCYLPSTEALNKKEQELRTKLNEILDKGELDMYPRFSEENELVQIIVNSNNVREFKY